MTHMTENINHLELMLPLFVPLFVSRGGIKDGDIIVKLNGRPLITTTDLQGALQKETALLLEVRRDNDDLLFNIEPDLIMQ